MKTEDNAPNKNSAKGKSRSKDEIDAAVELSDEQKIALELLQSGENVFLTGGAGSGKSFVIRQFMKKLNPKELPILASTGAAAILIGGRTFHSFFGLGIMEGGPKETLKRGLEDLKLMKRLREVEGVIIDEISMIPSAALEVAETFCRNARESDLPWGGMRLIVVGDFAQLPPVTRSGQIREWSFLSPIWERSGFQIVELTQSQRSYDSLFLQVLADVREGKVTARVKEYLDSKIREHDEEDEVTRLFPRRDQSEIFNQKKIAQIPEPEVKIPSIYLGQEKLVESLKKNSPIPGELVLKVGAKVLFVQNDAQKRWVNGTKGTVVDIAPDKITVEKESWRHVTVDKTQFSLQNAEGNTVASVINFPLTLAYATTIHKSQGATLDELWVDLSRLWEPGHAYVALSRLRSGDGLRLLAWNSRSILTDPNVTRFYREIQSLTKR
jgi:ATP-dependent exoDNAse (exonuclease V) alpha subunit